MTSRFIFVDNLLVRNAVDDADRLLINLLGGGFVAGANRFLHLLDCGTQLRAQARVVHILLDRLTRALAGLCRIGHDFLLESFEIAKTAYFKCLHPLWQ